jgi:hypothetical protein
MSGTNGTQGDLFARREDAGAENRPPSPRPSVIAASLDDRELIVAIPGASLRDAPLLAAEAARRGLKDAVPALYQLCRRTQSVSDRKPVTEQVAALAAMTQIGGRQAAEIVAQLLANTIITGPTRPAALEAAIALDAELPREFVLRLLCDPVPQIRISGCRLARKPSAEIVATLNGLLHDRHFPEIYVAAACALARLKQVSARPTLTQALEKKPSLEVIEAIASIPDETTLVLLRRIAQRHPSLADAVSRVLEEM